MNAVSAGQGASQVYESDRSLGEYLLFHYGSDDQQLPWREGPSEALGFPRRSVEELIDKKSSVGRALDLGCAVGKSSFVLAEIAGEVLGIDFSKSFIDAAQSILQNGKLSYHYHEEGTYWKEDVVSIDQIPQNLSFEVGDACNLRDDIKPFDLVHAANLLCRVSDPMSLLSRLPDLIVPGGQLILTTPFTWLEEFTPQENWLNGEKSALAVKKVLESAFDLELEKNLPFLIREHRRKFQYTVALGMRWRRKET
ncbi:MAG: putative 4-mercaptohistidine N1-methyltransferase [Opitutae bacterium]